MRLNKKGYFFILDAFLAVMILIAAAGLIFSQYFKDQSTMQGQSYSVDFLKFISETELINYNSPLKDSLILSGEITNIHQSIASQIGEFYYRWKKYSCDDCMSIYIPQMLGDVISDAVQPQYGVEVYIEELEYHAGDGTEFDPPWVRIISQEFLYSTEGERQLLASTPQVITSKHLVIGTYQEEELFGPYILKILIWRKDAK